MNEHLLKRGVYLIALLMYVNTPSWAVKGGFMNPLSEKVEDLTVSGKVIDPETSEGLTGVTIIQKGSNVGTVTDINGEYSITVSEGAVLVFNFIGYVAQEVEVNGRSVIDVTMEIDIETLDEIVLIGYGEVKRTDVTGSVVSMDSEALQKVNRVDAVSAIQGQVAGVVVQRTNNKPGSEGFNIRIRGASTINNNASVNSGGFSPGQNPLFIVDGMFVNDISFLNPADIERMDVLKDASATAIYGARGSNGVVIIKTKRGSDGKLTVRYNNYVGVRQAYNLPSIHDTDSYLEYLRDDAVGVQFAAGDLDARASDVDINDYLSEEEQAHIAEGVSTNWPDLMLKNGIQNNHTIDISGGNEKSIYGIGFGYTKDEGNIDGEDFTRYNLRANFSSDLTDKLNVSYNNYVTAAVQNTGSWEAFRSAYRLKPLGKPYNDDGSLRFRPTEKETQITNPLMDTRNITRESQYLQYLADVALKFSPIDGLSLTTKFSPNIKYTRYGEYRGVETKSVSGNVDNTRAQVDNFNDFSYTWDNIVNYDVDLTGSQNLSATFVYSRYKETSESYYNEVRGFTTDDYLFYNLDAGPDIREVSSTFVSQSIESYTGRINYGIQDKYLFTLTGRYDGASILSEDNKWAFFPSAAFAWRIGDESFVKSIQAISDAKVRLSYGQTGNNGAGGGLAPLKSQSLLSSSFSSLDNGTTQSAYINELANSDLAWERTTEINLGLDYGFFRNRLFGSIDVYNRKVSDIIFRRELSYITGYPSTFQNIGEATNRGIELGLNAVIIDNDDFKWSTNVNFAKNVNTIDKLYDDADIFFSANGANFIHRQGEAIGSIYDYEFDGIWNLDEAEEAEAYGQLPGQVRVKDIDGDGEITPDDRTILGNVAPDWTGGLTNTLSYKDWDFSFFIYTSQGNTQYSTFLRGALYLWDSDPSRLFNSYDANYWTPENESQEYHQPGNGGAYAGVSRYRDVSFTKVGYITLGYTFPSTLLDKAGIQSFRVYTTAQNPFIFTDYEGWDPESTGRDHWGASFLARSFIAGLNLTF